VLLPAEAPTGGLPLLATPVPEPPGAAGTSWPDDTVKRALGLLDAHRPRRLERSPQGWRLTLEDGKTLVVGP
jgi:hypothetical protein